MAAVDAVGKVLAPEVLLESARLGIGAVQDDKTAVGRFVGKDAVYNGRCRQVSLFLFCESLDQLYFGAGFGLGEALLWNPVVVVRNHAVGSVHDVLGRAVVLLQAEQFRFRIVLSEAEDVLDTGAPETVDALRVVTDHADILVGFGKPPDNQVLGEVGILVLVDEYVAESCCNGLPNIRMVFQQDVHIEQDIVKIHGSGLLALFRVAGKDLYQASATCGTVFFHQLRIVPVAGHRVEVVLGQ